MMAEPEEPSAGDEICPICDRPKSQHTPEEMLECTKKIHQSKDKSDKDETESS